jgi:hypothetical protein
VRAASAKKPRIVASAPSKNVNHDRFLAAEAYDSPLKIQNSPMLHRSQWPEEVPDSRRESADRKDGAETAQPRSGSPIIARVG